MDTRWQISENSSKIEWTVNDLHTDDIEMSGFKVSDVVTYGMNENGFVLKHHPVFPTLRTRPNNTHASFQTEISYEQYMQFSVSGTAVIENLKKAEISEVLRLECDTNISDLSTVHTCVPSDSIKASYERIQFFNMGDNAIELSLPVQKTEAARVLGPMGINLIEISYSYEIKTGNGIIMLKPGETVSVVVNFTGRSANENICPESFNIVLENRKNTALRLTSCLKLDTGNKILDTMFRFAKMRAGESVFDTKFGLIHSPGGYSYYAATWCNDQVEYSGPYFAYTGDEKLLEASANAYRMYIPFMDEKYEPIPSSVIAEGLDFWNGAGDRGDAAMYLYGASRFVLTSGRRDYAKELLPAIEWCAEYCRRQTNEYGVIASDSDELEGRFPSGNANLCTSTLTYAGLLGLSALEKEFGNKEKSELYAKRAADLKNAVDSYFGAEIHGLDTYKYYSECDILRSWICMPLCVGIYDRADETAKALTSEFLLKPDGMLTAEGCPTIWDRSTLYGLRGLFAAGETEKAMNVLMKYSTNRLLGERVPYAVEAYPEGGRRHLSGESALFCKVIIDGMLNIIPTGLRTFRFTVHLPDSLDHLYLENIHAHGSVFSIFVEKEEVKVTDYNGFVIASGKPGHEINVSL